MGGIGSILVLLVAVPSVGWILGIIGFILTLIAIKQISDHLEDRTIFNNMLISIVLGIAAIIVAAVTVIAAFFGLMGLGTFANSTFTMNQNIQPGDYVRFFLTVLPGLLGIWVLLILSAVFLRRAYETISRKLAVSMFGSAALVYLIGAITTVILIGFILIIIAEIMFAIAFFSIHETQVEKAPGQYA